MSGETELVALTVTTQAGETRGIEAPVGHTLMEAIRDAGFDEMLALCGGCCSCSTCHVYVDEGFLGRVSPVTEPESDLLEMSDHRTPASRLSCQIELTEDLAGMSVTLAPED